MNRRLTRLLVGLVATVVIAATVAFSYVVTTPSRSGGVTREARSLIPLIVHPANESLANCARCPAPDRGGEPPNHATYEVATCRTCHSVAPARPLERGGSASAPAPVPHPVVAPYDGCVGCPAVGGNLSMPGDHVDYAGDACGGCHTGPEAKQSRQLRTGK